MTPFHIVALVSALLVLSLICHYLDAKYRWQVLRGRRVCPT